MNFQDWKPYLLSPRLARANYRGGRTFVFGGCGFFLVYLMAKAMGYMMIWSVALMWDFMVLMTYGMVWLYAAPITWLVRAIKNKRAARRVAA